jgi:hypothetical protein
VHWLPLAEIAYNNSVHASTSITLFFADKGFHPSVETTIKAIVANRFVLDVPDAKAGAEKLVELWAAIEQHWNEAIATQLKYTDRRTKRREFEVSDIV